MEVNKFSGKDYDSVLEEALSKLNLKEEEVIISSEEKKGGLFKGKLVELTVTPLTDVLEFVKEYLSELLIKMGIEVSFETKIRDNQLQVKMYSNDNPLLIGRDGKNLAALQTVIRNTVKNEFGKSPYISLDVENYKDKQVMHLEKTAKRIAREVSETKIAVELDNMNSYERLIVHNAVANFEDIYTESVGEEPNRHVIIKPKEK
ncbi:MAG: KH domain-containing protein [Bacilli bacterium]|nr:KH domain-containing protein [Bacilli bacterium]